MSTQTKSEQGSVASPPPRRTVTIAQIGCGYWGPNLLRTFNLADACVVKYVVDQAEDRRNFVSRNYPAVIVDADLNTVLRDDEVDAVIIATPAATHYDLARKAMSHGKHVFVEKPLAMSTVEARELSALAAARKLVLMVGHVFLYNAAVTYLKGLIKSGELGEIFYVYSQRLNLGVIRADVNALWNLAPHDVSIINYLLDNVPSTVSAHGTAYIQPGVADVVFVNLEYGNRVRANIHVSWLDPNKVRRITVVGSRKMVVYDDIADDKIIIYDKGFDINTRGAHPFDAVTPNFAVQRVGDIHLPRIKMKEPLAVEAAHFIACVLSGETPFTGAQNGFDVVAVLEAAQKSLEGGSHVVPIGEKAGR